MSPAKRDLSPWRLIAADYLFLYSGRSESRPLQLLKGVRRFAVDPSLHAVVLIRLACSAPRPLSAVLTWVLRVKHGIVLGLDCKFGPGLSLAHPLLITIGPETRAGANVRIYHNCTVGSPVQGATLGDGSTLYCHSTVAPGVSVGRGAVVGANCTVTTDIPDNGVFGRNKLLRSRDE